MIEKKLLTEERVIILGNFGYIGEAYKKSIQEWLHSYPNIVEFDNVFFTDLPRALGITNNSLLASNRLLYDWSTGDVRERLLAHEWIIRCLDEHYPESIYLNDLRMLEITMPHKTSQIVNSYRLNPTLPYGPKNGMTVRLYEIILAFAAGYYFVKLIRRILR